MQIRKFQRKKKDLILDLTPLIDCVFVILIFFMLGTEFIKNNTGLKINLPKSTIVEVSQVQDLVIYIDKAKNIELNYVNSENKRMTEKSTIDTLEALLTDKLNLTKEKNIIIKADKELKHGDIVEIMTIAKKAGAESLDIATDDEK